MINFDSTLSLQYHTYNSLFLSLPFSGIETTGNHLALFAQACESGFKAGKSPEDIVEAFWQEYFENLDKKERESQLFSFIKYIERQVVLFDSVEDSLFDEIHDTDGPGSLNHFLSLLDTDELKEKLLEKIKTFSLRLVLTAHPTQFYPGKVLGIINDLENAISAHDLGKIRLLLMQLGKTAFVNREKPTPYDEAVSLGWYLENILFNTLPDILFRLLKATGQDPATFENPQLLALGFWPGGDRDGNPFVTADITLLVAQRLRESVLRGYYRDIRQLKRRLTFRGTEDAILAVERKIYQTVYQTDDSPKYESCQELLADLMAARKILLEEHEGLFLDDLDRFILKIRVFGFFFAGLDIRQDSRKHALIWQEIFKQSLKSQQWKTYDEFLKEDELTRINYLLNLDYYLDENDFADPFVKETIRSFKLTSEIQKNNGELGCHRYIISNCQSAFHVAEVLALAKLVSPNNECHLDIVPLFETVDDLKDAEGIMDSLYNNPYYAQHLASRRNIQHIMLGFSDGTKDGGYLMANWGIYQAKEALTRVSRNNDVKVIFFDGRGGPPGRGGGNNASYYAAQGSGIENESIQVTIQGQTVSSTYGTIESATFNMERLLTSGLEPDIFPNETREINEEEHAVLNKVSEASYQAYLDLKNHPEFVPYLEQKTPLRWYGDTNIASRPTKRPGSGLVFEDLRAIPFVGAWAQMKQNIPGYFGIGTAISKLNKSGKEEIRQLYHHSMFFRTLLENSMQSLAKSNFQVTQYLAKDPRFGPFWEKLQSEFTLSCQVIEELTGKKGLLSANPISRESIALRERIVLPLIAIQQYALQKISSNSLSASEQELYRNLVLRSMFGIINAARNAA